MEDSLAFLELEIPDDQLDEYLVTCMESHGVDKQNLEMDLEAALEEGGDPKKVAWLENGIRAMEAAETARDYLNVFGYTCLAEAVPPSMLKLLDPAAMLEALHSGDADAVAHAVKNVEATAFKSLNAAFWVWLMMLMGQIFGPSYGMPQGEASEEQDEEEAQRLERMREAATKRPRKKRPRKKSAAKPG